MGYKGSVYVSRGRGEGGRRGRSERGEKGDRQEGELPNREAQGNFRAENPSLPRERHEFEGKEGAKTEKEDGYATDLFG